MPLARGGIVVLKLDKVYFSANSVLNSLLLYKFLVRSGCDG